MMMRLYTVIIALILAVAAVSDAAAQSIVRKGQYESTDTAGRVVVDGDTVSMVLPQRNWGRFDRGLKNYIFIPRNQWGFGLTASYGELQTRDLSILSVLKDFDFSGELMSLAPYMQYSFDNNEAVGLKFNYTRGTADLRGFNINITEDISFNVRDVMYSRQDFSVSTFYRYYVGLGKSGRFGIFNELDLAFGSGGASFDRLYNDMPRHTRTVSTSAEFNYSPGLTVFIQENVAFNVSFGVFGLHWLREHQSTDGIDEGTRVSSGANFRFNIFNINFGMMIAI